MDKEQVKLIAKAIDTLNNKVSTLKQEVEGVKGSADNNNILQSAIALARTETLKGDIGDKGEQGIQGENGKDGKDGLNGLDGKDGSNGLNGKDGKNGKDGQKGEKGEKGDKGDQGRDGNEGSPDNAIDIRDKLESLIGNEKLSSNAIGGLKKFVVENAPQGGGGGAVPIDTSVFIKNPSDSKTTPIDADSVLLQDSADSNIWKKLTWSNLKATLGLIFENKLTFSNGLARTANNIVNTLITGLTGGQTVIGGINASENLTLQSTSHATKGLITSDSTIKFLQNGVDATSYATQSTSNILNFEASRWNGSAQVKTNWTIQSIPVLTQAGNNLIFKSGSIIFFELLDYANSTFSTTVRFQSGSGSTTNIFHLFWAKNTNTTIGNYAGFGATNGNNGTVGGLEFKMLDHALATPKANMEFWLANGGAATQLMTLLSTGSLGIGTGSPSAKLDVLGTARFGDHATNYTEFGTDGTLTLNGTATVFKDQFVDGLSLRPGETAPTFAVFQGGVWANWFNDGAVDEAHGSFEIQHDYKEGTPLEVHLHWAPSTVNVGNCRWSFEYTVANMATETFGATTTLTVDAPSGGTAFKHNYVTLGSIAGTGRLSSDVIMFRIYREGTHANDTFTGSGALLRIAFHYESNRLGSNT